MDQFPEQVYKSDAYIPIIWKVDSIFARISQKVKPHSYPFQDAVTHYGRVVWLRPSLPLISNKLLDQVSYQISNMSSNSAQKSPFIFLLNKRPVSSVFHLGHVFIHHILWKKVQVLLNNSSFSGFLPYFPMSIETRGKINFRNSSAVWLDRHPSTFEIIRW